MREQRDESQLADSPPEWVRFLPAYPQPTLSVPCDITFMDGTERESVIQLFDDISAEVVRNRLADGLEQEGWVPDGEAFVHPTGVVVRLALEEPKPNRVVAMLTRVR